MRTRLSALAVLSLLAAPTARGQAAPDTSPARTSVISIQPLSAMLTVYSGEYEHAVSPTVTLGLGTTYWGAEAFDAGASYLSGDFKVRYYPAGQALRGFSFGGSVGVTHVSASDGSSGGDGSTTGAAVGTLLEYGWLLGVEKRFYVGLGVGAKALFIGEKSFTNDITLRYPTARISVGMAF